MWKIPLSVGNLFTRDVLQSILTEKCEPVPLAVQLICFRRRYRTYDGSCNNLCNITKGSALRPFARLLPPAYEDGTYAPRTLGSNNESLPNARNISTIVFVSSTGNDDNMTPNFTHVTMTWGQFLDHDITLTQENNTADCGNNSLPCRGHDEGCISIDILKGNELKDNRSAVCIPLRRSAIQDGEQVSDGQTRVSFHCIWKFKIRTTLKRRSRWWFPNSNKQNYSCFLILSNMLSSDNN